MVSVWIVPFTVTITVQNETPGEVQSESIGNAFRVPLLALLKCYCTKQFTMLIYMRQKNATKRQ
jgi:hypothetical protein